MTKHYGVSEPAEDGLTIFKMSTIISDDPQNSLLEQIRSFSARCVTLEKNYTRNVIVEHCMIDHDEVTSSRSLFTRNKSQVVKNCCGSVFEEGI